MKNRVGLATFGLVVARATGQSTVGAYGQCGGSGYTGATACGSGYICTEYNAYYEQCVPGTTVPNPTTTTTGSTSSPSTVTAPSTTVPTTTSTTAASSSGSSSITTAPSSTGTAATGVPTTLVSGWYWIRAVESPYYHSYLQTLPTATPGGDALMDDPATAGQFNIIDGQLVYYTGASSAPLYLWVEDPADKTQRALATWFNSTAGTYGNFSFSGDTVTWTDPDVARPNTAAFYVCPGGGNGTDVGTDEGENALFVNTGAYLYETPSGCYDIDIHYYGGSTATV